MLVKINVLFVGAGYGDFFIMSNLVFYHERFGRKTSNAQVNGQHRLARLREVDCAPAHVDCSIETIPV